MPTNTTNFNLIKPNQEEFYDVSVPNANMDTIDGILKALQTAISSGASEEDLNVIQQALAMHLDEKSSLTVAGHVMLSNSIVGSSEEKAATEKAVKDAVKKAYEDAQTWSRSMGFGETAKVISGTDLNILDVNGIYMGSLLANAPAQASADQWFFVENIKHNHLHRKQIAHAFTMGVSGKSYQRTQINGNWTVWSEILTSSFINIPWGIAGLDGNGKLASSLTSAVLIHSYNFATSPTTAVNFTGLDAYKELKVIIKGLQGAQNSSVNLHLNNVPANGSHYWLWPYSGDYTYPNPGTGGAGSFQLGSAEPSVAKMNGHILISNETIYDTFIETRVKGEHPTWQYRPAGTFQVGGLASPQLIHTLNVSSTGNMNNGIIEVWGLKR